MTFSEARAQPYVAALAGIAVVATTLGFVIVGRAWLAAPPALPLLALAAGLAGAVFLAHRRALVLYWRTSRTSVTFDEPAILLALLLLPPLAAVAVVAISQSLVQLVARRRALKAVYNVSAYTSAAAAGSVVAVLLGTRAPPLVAAMAGLVAYTLASHLLVAALFARLEDASVLRIFRERFLQPTILHVTLGLAVSLALIGLWSVHPLATLAIVPFAYVTLSGVRLHARVEREVEAHRRLAAMTTALAGESDVARAIERVIDTCGDLFHAGRAAVELESGASFAREFEGGPDGSAPLVAELVGRHGARIGILTVHPGRRARDRNRDAEPHVLALVAGQAAAAIENVTTLHAMRELRDLNAGVVENVPAGVIRLAPDATALHANEEAARLLGGRDGSILSWSGFQRNPLLAALVQEVLDGKGFTDAEVETDGTFLAISAVPLRQSADGSSIGAVLLVHDVTARKATEEARRTDAVTRPLVRRIITRLVGKQEVSRRAIGEVGRDLARGLGAQNAHDYAMAFRSMGLGALAFKGVEGGYYRFEADDLLETRAGSTQPTCHLALGFVEGAVAAIAGGAAALGTELRCQSMGHARCEFVAKPFEVAVRPTAPAAAVAKVTATR